MLFVGCSQDSQTNSNSTTNQSAVLTTNQSDALDLKRENLGNDLSTAVLFGDKSKVVELLDQGADVNYLSVGWTPLDIAIKHERQELVTLLRERGGKTATELGIHPNRETAAVTFTRSITGYDWQRADAASKRQFCDTIAPAMSKEFKRDFSGDFYLEALDSFYKTSDPNVLKQNIHSVVGLVTSAAMNSAAQ